MYFNVNFNVFFKLIKVHLLVSELYIYQNARCNDKNLSTESAYREGSPMFYLHETHSVSLNCSAES